MGSNKDKTFIGKSKREEFNEFEDLYKGVEAFMGYLPNAHLTMSESLGLLTKVDREVQYIKVLMVVILGRN